MILKKLGIKSIKAYNGQEAIDIMVKVNDQENNN